MSLRWIDQGNGRLVAVHGAYRLRIQPSGLVFQTTLFFGRIAGNSRDWQHVVTSPAASIDSAKRRAEDLLASELEQTAPAAAQGGL